MKIPTVHLISFFFSSLCQQKGALSGEACPFFEGTSIYNQAALSHTLQVSFLCGSIRSFISQVTLTQISPLRLPSLPHYLPCLLSQVGVTFISSCCQCADPSCICHPPVLAEDHIRLIINRPVWVKKKKKQSRGPILEGNPGINMKQLGVILAVKQRW